MLTVNRINKITDKQKVVSLYMVAEKLFIQKINKRDPKQAKTGNLQQL